MILQWEQARQLFLQAGEALKASIAAQDPTTQQQKMEAYNALLQKSAFELGKLNYLKGGKETMDPVTFQLFMAGLSVGSQALTLYGQNKEKMTIEQAGMAEGMISRINAAQNLVTPYVKEKEDMSEKTKGWLKGLYVAVIVAFGGGLVQVLANPQECANWTWPQWRMVLIVSGIMGLASAIAYLIKSPLPENLANKPDSGK